MLKLFFLNSVSCVVALFAFAFLGFSYWGYNGNGHRPLGSGERQLIEQASAFIDQARRSNGQLPTRREFSVWSSAMDDAGYRYDAWAFAYVTYGTAPLPPELIQCFGDAPPNAYGFSFWTGDESVVVTSWQKDLHIACSDGSNYLFGRRFYARMFCATVGLILLALATWLQLLSGQNAQTSQREQL